MADAELVIDVRIGAGDVGDRVVAEHQPLEHRLVDGAADLLLVGADRIELGLVHRRRDDLAVDGVEIGGAAGRVGLAAERHQDEAERPVQPCSSSSPCFIAIRSAARHRRAAASAIGHRRGECESVWVRRSTRQAARGIIMPAEEVPSPPRKPPKQEAAPKMGPIRLPAIAEDQLTAEQRSLMGAIASGPRGTFKMSGPFFCYLHCAGLRRAGAEARRLLPLRHLDRAAADRIRDPHHRAFVEGALRMGGARAAGAEGRREARDHPGAARRPRADIGAEGRARDLCLHQGALRARGARATAPTRPCMPSWATPAWSSWSACSATTPWWR